MCILKSTIEIHISWLKTESTPLLQHTQTITLAGSSPDKTCFSGFPVKQNSRSANAELSHASIPLVDHTLKRSSPISLVFSSRSSFLSSWRLTPGLLLPRRDPSNRTTEENVSAWVQNSVLLADRRKRVLDLCRTASELHTL